MNLSSLLSSRPRTALAVVGFITILLAIPFIGGRPPGAASQEPTGGIFDARDRVEERFVSTTFFTPVIIEDRSDDLLRVQPLLELHENLERLRTDPTASPTLLRFYHPVEQQTATGMWTVADMVNSRLPNGLAEADDLEVKLVARDLIELVGITDLGLSKDTTFDAEIDGVTDLPASAAVRFSVLSDDEILGFGGAGVRVGATTEPEEYSRRLLDQVRGDETNYRAWGLGIDINLTSAEEGDKAGPFIALTIAAILLIVGITFRSYWVVAVTGAGVATMFVWLGGASNLLGLKDDLLLSFIVPIAMVSFGVDFAFHALSRYQEERRKGEEPQRAFVVGLSLVLGALVLALVSDSAAFLTNAAADIEAIVQFGIGATIALVAAFILLGLVAPLVVMMIEQRVGRTIVGQGEAGSTWSTVGKVAASAAAVGLATGAAMLSVFVDQVLGLIVLGVYLIVAIVAPYLYLGRGARSRLSADDTRTSPRPRSAGLGSVIARLAGRPLLVLIPAVAISIVAGWFALRLPVELDAKDFFSTDSDFVVGLDKFDEHAGAQDGESADVLIETDLTDPVAVRAIADFVDDLKSAASPHLSRTAGGDLVINEGVVSLLADAVSSPTAMAMVESESGTSVAKVGDAGIPESEAQLDAVLRTISEQGIPVEGGELLRTPQEVRSVLWLSEDSDESATVVTVWIAGSRQVTNIEAARSDMAPLIQDLQMRLDEIDESSSVTFTGGPIARQESLRAVADALQRSLILAVIVCALIASVFMRSIRYAAVVIVPILMVISWLYGVMYMLGFGINLVTASIGAVSLGIGIDFAIHFAYRYREEFERLGDGLKAVEITATETGRALIASAGSSVVGFTILAFAPMPLFASYGLLTALMIVMALVSSLVILPCILTLTSRS